MRPNRLLTLVCSLSLLVTATAAKAETYAFLVGIADYPDVLDANGNRAKDEIGNFIELDLHGPINDVNVLKDLFVNKYGIKPDNIRTALDGKANKDGFLSGFAWLMQTAKPGDQIIFYYSGHGGQLPDKTEEDGFEEVICLADDTLVSGDLFNQVARDVSSKGIDATFLFDSCYSGGMSRDIFSYGGKSGAAKRKFAVAKAISKMKKVPQVDLQKIKASAKGKPAAGGSYLFVSAGQENQPTSDLDFTDENTLDHGLFTLVLSILLDLEPSTPTSDVIDAMKAILTEKGFDQIPMFEASSSARASEPVIKK